MWTRRPRRPAPQPRGGIGAPALSPRPAVQAPGCLWRLPRRPPTPRLPPDAPRRSRPACGSPVFSLGSPPAHPTSASPRFRSPVRPPSRRSAPSPALSSPRASSSHDSLLRSLHPSGPRSCPGLGKSLPRVGPLCPPPIPTGRLWPPGRPPPARTKARRLPRWGGRASATGLGVPCAGFRAERRLQRPGGGQRPPSMELASAAPERHRCAPGRPLRAHPPGAGALARR